MRRARRILVICVLVGAVVSVGYWQRDAIRGLFGEKGGEETLPSADRLFTVTKQGFEIILRERGVLKAKKSAEIRVPKGIGDRIKLLWIIDDGAKVKKGDKVFDLDKEKFEKTLADAALDLERLKKEKEVAEERLKVVKSRKELRLKSAADSLEQSKKNREKYITLEAPRQQAEREAAVQSAKTKVGGARQAVTDAQEKVANELFVDEDQRKKNLKALEGKKSQYQATLKGLESAKLQFKIFRKHTYPEKRKSLDDSIESAKLSLKDTKIDVDADIIAEQNALDQKKLRIKNQEAKLKEYRELLPKLSVVAPVDGIVHYGQPRSGRWRGGSSNEEIGVGKEYWAGAVLANIPNVTDFEIVTQIPETSRGKIKKGLKVEATAKAVSGLVLSGEIKQISFKAQRRVRWDSSSPKVFPVTISVQGGDGRLSAEMTAEVKIFVGEVPPAPAVPVEAVFAEGKKNFAYRYTGGRPEKVFVTTKESNETYVVVEGLEEGDRVYLFDPYKDESQ